MRSRYDWELTSALPLLSSTMFMITCGGGSLQKIQETSRQREACGQHGRGVVQLKKFEWAGMVRAGLGKGQVPGGRDRERGTSSEGNGELLYE